jgi:hypothetical protein
LQLLTLWIHLENWNFSGKKVPEGA